MENAVKALLIAAAVLIAILLISMVMGVFDTGAEQVENADLSAQETQSFNDKFLQYRGNNLSGSKVNAMLKTVHSHNNVQEDETTQVTVTDSSTDGNGNIATTTTGYTTPAPKVSTGRRYNVDATIDAVSGLVTTLTITDAQ